MEIPTSHSVPAALYPAGRPENAVRQQERHEGKAESSTDRVNPTASDSQTGRVRQLEANDRGVRAHEQAHLAAAAGIAISGASFTYTQGPDGKRYAVGGEVSIDTSPVPNDPRATLLKAEQIRRAALAPADPSAQDRQVAATASQMAMNARIELQQQARASYRENAAERETPVAISLFA